MSNQVSSAPNPSYRVLLCILLAALLLRLGWWLYAAPVVSQDGAEYLCAARNLVRGHGYVGCYEGPELMYAPLYPVLIAAASIVFRNLETAAHLVSLLFGIFLIVPVFLTAWLIYGKRVAYISAVLTALYPVLIKLAGSTFTEAPYVTLFMSGIYCGLRALESRSAKYCLLTGTCFALAYLGRPEAFAYPAFFAIAICIVAVLTRKPLHTAIGASASLLGAFLLFTLPYIVFLSSHTGQLRLEGKWNINYTIGKRIQAGMDYTEAAYGVGAGTNSSGPLLQPSHFAAYTPFSHTFRDKLRYMTQEVLLNRFDVYNLLSSTVIGAPITFVLVVLGLFRKTWGPRRCLYELVLLIMAASILILLLTAQQVQPRYIFPLVPLVILWSSKGIEEFGRWVHGVVASFPVSFFANPLLFTRGTEIVLAALVISLAFHGSRSLAEFRAEGRAQLPTKRAALWLKNYCPGPKRIATWDAQVTWYADAAFVQIPDSDPSTTLRYIDSQKADFIYIDRLYPRPAPTMEAWLSRGILDSHAKLIYETGRGDNRILIYRWLEGAAGKLATYASK